MTPKEMLCLAHEAKKDGGNITFILKKRPKGFPRGELLCVHPDGTQARSFCPEKVIRFLEKNGLV